MKENIAPIISKSNTKTKTKTIISENALQDKTCIAYVSPIK